MSDGPFTHLKTNWHHVREAAQTTALAPSLRGQKSWVDKKFICDDNVCVDFICLAAFQLEEVTQESADLHHAKDLNVTIVFILWFNYM